VAWLLLEGAKIALDKTALLPEGDAGAKDRAFYQGKLHAAAYFARSVLPAVKLDAEIMGREDTSPLDISDDSFATV
jgi:hypothetical protein